MKLPTLTIGSKPAQKQLQRVLIARLSSLGDVVCSLPCASLLKEAAPECEIHWVVDPRFAGVLDCCPAVDKIIAIKPSMKSEVWAGLERPYDAALDLQGLAKSALAVLKSRAKTVLGYHWQREGSWLASSRVIPDPTSFHVVDQYLDAARSLLDIYGLDIPEQHPASLVPKEEDIDKMKQLVDNGGPFAVINAGAGWATKRWPPESFGRVIVWLETQGIQSVLIGGKAPADQEAAAAAVAHAQANGGNPRNLLGQTSVRELIALISICRIHIGGDTGSTHIAAELGIPAVGLYSITKPIRTCPYGQFSNCLYSEKSLADIPFEQVRDKLLTLLK